MPGDLSSRAALLALHFLFYSGFALLAQLFTGVHPVFTPVLAILLIWISVVDIQRFEIPDLAAALLVLTGMVCVYALGLPVLDHLIAAMLWPLLFWAVGVAYMHWRGFQGLGFGDVKLMVGIGAWLGFGQTTLVVFAAAMAGVLVLLVTNLIKRKSISDIGTRAVAFGPFLCLSTWVIWIF